MKVLNGVALIRWLYVDFSQLNEYFIAPTSSYKCEQLLSFWFCRNIMETGYYNSTSSKKKTPEIHITEGEIHISGGSLYLRIILKAENF